MERLRKRFIDLVCLVVGSCVVAGAGIAVCNDAFVHIWTLGRMTWHPMWSLLLGALLVLGGLRDFHAGLIPMTKDIGALKHAYVLEGGLFIGLGFLIAPQLGFAGLLVLALLCRFLLTTVYSLWRSAHFLELPVKELTARWLGVLTQMGWRMAVIGTLAYLCTMNAGSWVRFMGGGTVVLVTGAFFLSRVCLGDDLRAEVMARVPARLAPLLRACWQ